MKHLALALLCSTLAALAQTAPDRDQGIIEGTISNALNGDVLKKSVVTANLVGGRSTTVTAITGSDGRYSFTGLNPGKYVVLATHTGYVTQGYGSKGVNRGGSQLTLSAGGKLTGIDIKLAPQGVITGRVVDEDGDPIAAASVQLLRQAYVKGHKQMMPSQGATSNDRGEYRIYGLPPGKYLVSASHQSSSGVQTAADTGLELAYGTTYYPNAPNAASAAPLEIAPGTEMHGIDMSLVRARAVRVRGTVLDGDNQPIERASVWLAPRDSTAMYSRRAGNAGEAILNGKGSFELHGVAPGSYYLFASVGGGRGQRMAGRTTIEVGPANLEGITVSVRPPVEMIAHIVLEGQTDAAPKSMGVYLQPKDPGMFGTPVSGNAIDGPIRLQVTPDIYEVNVMGMSAGQYLKTVKFGEIDVTDMALDFSQGIPAGEITVVVSPSGGQVDGTVQDEKDQPSANSQVVLVPEKRSVSRLYFAVTTDATGHFSFRGVPPGDYRLFCWDQVENGSWQDPDFLKAYESHGESVSVKENAHESRQLKVIPGGS